MKWLGQLLMALGALLGTAVAFAMIVHPSFAFPWLVAIGLAKLTLVTSLGLMGGGAALLRLDNRRRSRLARGSE